MAMKRHSAILIAMLVVCAVALIRPLSAQVYQGIPVNCFVPVSTLTALTAVGGSCMARTSGNAIYITDISSSANVGSLTADTHNTLKYGTGTACATGTTTVWEAFFTAGGVLANTAQQFKSPLRIPPGNDLCWINTTVGSKIFVITGYEAP